MKKRIITTLIIVCLVVSMIPITASANDDSISNPFVDVNESDWFYEATMFALKHDLFAGTSETTFEPDQPMTRAMFVTVLYRFIESQDIKGNSSKGVGYTYDQLKNLGVIDENGYLTWDFIYEDATYETKTIYVGTPEARKEFFESDDGFYLSFLSDINDDEWYASYAHWAVTTGIVTGYDDYTFRPDELISRQDMAVMITRACDNWNISLEGIELEKEPKDESQISDYAKEAVNVILESRLMNGYPDNSFGPKDTTLRSECAQIFYNFVAREDTDEFSYWDGETVTNPIRFDDVFYIYSASDLAGLREESIRSLADNGSFKGQTQYFL